MSEQENERETRLARAVERLTQKEAGALAYARNAKVPVISAELNEKFFDLFKHGKTCDEIRKLNPGLSLGQIVAARVGFGWDERLVEERSELMEKLPGQVTQVQGEAIDFLARLLSVNHKLFNDAIDKFLQTGDHTYLRELPMGIGSIKEYRALLDGLQKATGQNNKKVVEHRGSVDIHSKGPVTQAEAANILDVLPLPTDQS